MSVYVTMLGAVFLSSSFVLFIWLKVLYSAYMSKDVDVPRYQLLITSIGLVTYSISILMIMVCRLIALFRPFDLDTYIYLCYVGMVASDILFLISAALGDNFRQVRWLLLMLGIWFLGCFIYNFF